MHVHTLNRTPEKQFVYCLTFICLLAVSLFLAAAVSSYAANSQTSFWGFNNSCYLTFDQGLAFPNAPRQGVSSDSGLVGYWHLDEGSGTIAVDSSGNSNNGSLIGATWANGKYGYAVNFSDTQNVINIPDNISLSPTTALTLCAWINPSNETTSEDFQRILTKGGIDNAEYTLWRYNNGGIIFYINTWEDGYIVSPTSPPLNSWTYVVAVFDAAANNTLKLYINGVLEVQGNTTDTSIARTTAPVTIGNEHTQSKRPFAGILDEVRIYDRALNASEVFKLYAMNPNAEPEPANFNNYWNFTDPVTKKSMLLDIYQPETNVQNSSTVTCINFFNDDAVSFQANSSAIVNIWTTLGKPAFIKNGVWNGENYTATLTLDANSTAELTWEHFNVTTYTDDHSTVFPSNLTLNYGDTQTFNFNTSQGYHYNVYLDDVSLGQISNYTIANITRPHIFNVATFQSFTIISSVAGNGSINPSGSFDVAYGNSQLYNFTANTGYHISKILVDDVPQRLSDFYLFSNVAENHTIDVSFAINTYTITTFTDEHSTINPQNVSVNFGETQQFNITTDDGFVRHVFVDEEDQGNITYHNFVQVHGNHTLLVTSEPIAPTAISSIAPSQNPSASPTSLPTGLKTPQASNSPPAPTPQTQQSTSAPIAESNSFPTGTVLIAAVITAIIVCFGVAFKKGYISIEVVDDEHDNHAIKQNSNEDSHQ